MSNVVRPPFVVCVPHPDGERFLIIRPDTMIARTFPPKPGERWPEAVHRFFQNEPQLTEADLRARLTDMGLDERAANEQVHRARRLREFNDLSSWEHITSIGFRNREGQTVVRKTDRPGSSPEQRVFVLRCTVCGHQYGAEGSEIYGRLCPRCQDGPAGLPT